jgi:hypothetical protein
MQLYRIDAIYENGQITNVGRMMAGIPLFWGKYPVLPTPLYSYAFLKACLLILDPTIKPYFTLRPSHHSPFFLQKQTAPNYC